MRYPNTKRDRKTMTTQRTNERHELVRTHCPDCRHKRAVILRHRSCPTALMLECLRCRHHFIDKNAKMLA